MGHRTFEDYETGKVNQSNLGTPLTEIQKRSIESGVFRFLVANKSSPSGCEFLDIHDAYDKFTVWNDELGGNKSTLGFFGISKNRFRRSLWHLNDRGQIHIYFIREVESGVSGFGLIDQPKLRIRIDRPRNIQIVNRRIKPLIKPLI